MQEAGHGAGPGSDPAHAPRTQPHHLHETHAAGQNLAKAQGNSLCPRPLTDDWELYRLVVFTGKFISQGVFLNLAAI